MMSQAAIWHEVECGGYEADLGVWQALALESDGPVLEVGAGSGRVSLFLAADGIDVVALDTDPELLAELRVRAGRAGLGGVTTVCADARESLGGSLFGLIIVPMQTIQLFGGARGRAAFLAGARDSLKEGGRVAAAVAELAPVSSPAPVGYPPDRLRVGETTYESRPTCVRSGTTSLLIERNRVRRDAAGVESLGTWSQEVDVLGAGQLEREASDLGLAALGRRSVASSGAYAGSEVVVLGR